MLLTEDEVFEELEAIHTGRATRLLPCCLCYLELTGKPVEREFDGPLRGVVRTFVGGGSDPTKVYVLTCGHKVI